MKVVVIGAGIGGLSAAAALARQGYDVTVLEAQVYPGGCAATYYHQGYRFDSGATLAGGFYPGGPMDLLSAQAGIDNWECEPASPAMVVHLPGGASIPRYGGDQRWAEHQAAFGERGLEFWRWQERTAGAMWDLALRLPPWPPGSFREAARLTGVGLRWLGDHLRPFHLHNLAADAFRPVADHLRGQPENLRLFVDSQLLISAQADSLSANALYGAAALDLPRRGVVHLKGGMGAIAARLAQAVVDHGGQVLYRQQAAHIRFEHGLPAAVETRRDSFPAGLVIANLTPWDLVDLLKEDAPSGLVRLPSQTPQGWGAFVLYLGIHAGLLPADIPLHHQVIKRRPLGEGNSVFLSISPAWDAGRAPQGMRAITLSTHTRLEPWWQLVDNDRPGYENLKAEFAGRLLEAAEALLPGIRSAVDLSLPGTPVTFARFVRRYRGWVGGFPQTNLLRSVRPRRGKGLWLVGDSIFPGQSTAATALGGLRVARSIMGESESI